MKLDLTNCDVVLEVTRRCPLRCDHCLRGDPEGKDMQKGTIAKIVRFLAAKEWGGHLTLSGGEPLGVPNVISEVAMALKRTRVGISGFYIATSGEFPTESIDHVISVLSELYGSCSYYDLDNISTVQFSADPYRVVSELAKENHNRMERFIKIITMRSGNGRVMREGRAKELCENLDPSLWLDLEEPEIEVSDEGDTIMPTTLYFNVHGECFPHCDLSYETQSELNGPIVIDSDFEEQLIDDLMEYQSGRKSVCNVSYGEDYERNYDR